jgi:foldase protein PrsA
VKNIKKILSLISAGVLVFSLTSCSLIEKTPEAIAKTVVAKVNGEKITKADLDAEMVPVLNQITAQYGADYATTADGISLIKTQKLSMLDELITNKLLAQKAVELKLMPTDAELAKDVDTKFADIKKAYTDDATWQSALTQSGLTEVTLKAYIKVQTINSAVAEYMVKDVTVTDAEITAYYQQHPLEYTTKTNTITLSHILVADKTAAEALKKQLDAGADFAKLAKANNTDGTKDAGGSLGTINQNDTSYDATFMAAALKLKKGETSSVIQTSYGYHIIRVTDRKDYPVKPLSEVKDTIKATVLDNSKQAKYTDTLTKWKSAATITKYEDRV